MSEEKPQILDESEIPSNWQEIEVEPIRPGQASGAPPPPQDHLPLYFRGSLAPALQHDAQLVALDKNPRVPVYPLVPLNAAQGKIVIVSDGIHDIALVGFGSRTLPPTK